MSSIVITIINLFQFAQKSVKKVHVVEYIATERNILSS